MDFDLILRVSARFVHVASVITLLGGIIALRCVAGTITDEVAARWKGVAWTTVISAFAAGLYNFLAKEGVPPGYHMWFGIKFLLALHVMAAALLIGKSGTSPEKRSRLAFGAMISGLAVVLVSAWLRWMP